MIPEPRIRHPAWSSARHLALPMLLCWIATPIGFNGVPIYGRLWIRAWVMLVLSIGIFFVYVYAAILNYRHVKKVLARGQCLECGYELWPTIKALRWECPECGAKISNQMAERVFRLRSLSELSKND
ncbi:MAG: hypothetical protein AAGH99_01330 [Planctomycetota bacterium]